MGTRNLTMVISGKQTKVAQYGQWDGYPEGQGQTILKFLRRVNQSKFKEKVNALQFATENDLKVINQYIEKRKVGNNSWNAYDTWGKYAYLSRDIGGKILTAIMGNPVKMNEGVGEYKEHEFSVKLVVDGSNFAADSLFCEWAYVIDLDKGTFEVYKGFNKTPLGKDQRFRYMQDLNLHMDKKDDGTLSSNGYYPVRHLATFKLKDLPTPQEFLKTCMGKREYAEHLNSKRKKKVA